MMPYHRTLNGPMLNIIGEMSGYCSKFTETLFVCGITK